MRRTKHSKVLSTLEKRSLRFHSKGQKQVDMDEVLYNKTIDETGTVSTVGLPDSDDDTIATGITASAATYLENEEIQGVSDNLLNVHDIAPGAKPEGVMRLI
jgi:hypothetical protein